MDFKDYLGIHGKGYVIKMLYPKNNEFVVDTLTLGYASVKPEMIKISDSFIFDIASLTKTITAIIVHRAVEQNLIKLEDIVSDVDDRFIHLKDISILDLVTHHQEIWTDGFLGDATSKEEFLKMLFNSVVKNKKRTYVDSHYIILSVILEKIYGMPYDKIVENEIIRVLDLKNTKFSCESSDSVVSNNYETVGDKLIDDIELGICRDTKARRAKELGIYTGHAGVFTTADDFLIILKSLIDDEYRLLSKNSVQNLILHDDVTEELFCLIKNFIKEKDIECPDFSNLNDLYNYIISLGYSDLKSKVFKPYNYLGTRYKNVIDDKNDIPLRASDNSVLFSGYTGPLFMIDFDKKIIILIMTNTCHCNVLGREKRYNKSTELMSLLYDEVLKKNK